MIKLVKNLAMVLVGLGGFVAIGNAISWLVEWLCADNGRFILGMIICWTWIRISLKSAPKILIWSVNLHRKAIARPVRNISVSVFRIAVTNASSGSATVIPG
jgi:hypothetical protein